MSGFATVSHEGVRVDVGKEYEIDFTLKVAAVAETLTVVGESPIVDPKASEVTSNFQYEFLQSIPVIRGSNTPRDFLALNPAVDVSYSVGGSPAGGTAWMFDGVDVSNPDHGNAWPFFNYDYIEETEVITYGAPAEYGGMTGAVFNVVTKTGGSEHHGSANLFYSGEGLNGDNVKGINEKFKSNSSFTEIKPGVVLKRWDWNFNMGGPVVKNRFHYFASYQRIDERATDPALATTLDNPFNRILLKGTWQLNPKHRINGSYEFDDYDLTDTPPFTGSPDPNANSFQPSPTFTPYVHWQWTPDENSVIEAQFSGFYGYVDLFPDNDLPAVIDWGTYQTYQSYPGYYHFGRERSEVRADYTRFVDDWAGRHEFKFGAGYMLGEIEDIFRFNQNSLGQNVQYYAYFGEIYGGITRLGDFERIPQVKSFKLYAQDAWTIGDRLTLNLGLRYDRHTARYKTPDVTPFGWNDVSPRVFATFDVTGSGKTVIRGGWGIYKEDLYGRLFRNFDPSLPVTALFNFVGGGGGCRRPVPGFPNIGGGPNCFAGLNAPNVEVVELRNPLLTMGIDPDLTNELQNHYVIGLEQELRADWSLGATFVRKTTSNIFGGRETRAQFAPTTVTDPLTGGTIQAFRRLTPAAASFRVLTNRDDLFTREYNGLDIRLKKRFRNNWQILTAYTIQKASGNANNSDYSAQPGDPEAGFRPPTLRGDNPNHLINAEGELTNSRRHLFKVQGSYRVPTIDVLVGGYLNVQSGVTYNRLIRARLPERVSILAEPRGSRRLPTLKTFDLRVEKKIPLGGRRGELGILLDALNLFNDDAITAVNTTTGDAFELPENVIDAREVNIAIRWSF
jgi:outer membrane receptor protein involved in Fe transport